MQNKKGSFLKERFLFSSGFVLLEAVFCLMLAGIVLWLFSFYVSLPKTLIKDQESSYAFERISTQVVELKSSSNLVFKVRRIRLRQGESVYTSFEVMR